MARSPMDGADAGRPAFADDGEPHADHIGPYRILRLLGEGGMGVVYEAEQIVPIRRRVAIKVVRSGLDSSEIIARFQAERQALALMDHPSIAKVLDAGSERGAPYFVMELVRGIPITEYSDAHSLSIRERIELFIPVCRAIQHAHQKGVIHRDLKPSNVLVTEAEGKPLPKIIDFGIAKAVSQHLTERTLVTMFGQAMGTPAYMSPEQAQMSGLDIDTRSDIYSLGVMLYELLVGRLPEDPTATGLASYMARLAQGEADPPTPSARLTTLATERETLARLRRTDSDGLRRELRGDIDCIVMRAMEPDRNRRYETANGLALDLGRFLADETIHARRPTPTERLRKFARRHRVGVAAAAIVLVAMTTGAVAATVGFVRATRAEARARQDAATAQEISRFLVGLFRVSDPNSGRGNAVTAREILDSGAARIGRELDGQPLVQARLMATIGEVYAELGLYPEAERNLGEALATRRRALGAGTPEAARPLISLGRLYMSQGRYAQAESTLLEGLRLTRAAEDRVEAPLARPLAALAELYRRQGSFAPADSFARAALAAVGRSLGEDDPEVADRAEVLAMLQAEQGRPAAAESLFRRVLAIRERAFAPGHPKVGRAIGNLAGALFEQGKLDEAERLYRRGLALNEKTYGPTHSDVAIDLYNVGNVESARRRFDEAIAHYARAIAIWERAFGPEHPYVGAALTAMSGARTAQGRPADAVPLLQRALAIRERTLAPDHPHVATTHNSLGVAFRQLRRFAEAETHLGRALAIRQKSLEPTSYYTAVTYGATGDLYQDEGRLDDAEEMYRRALKQWEASGRPRDQDFVEMTAGYVAMLRRQGRAAEASELEAQAARRVAEAGKER